jgi:hypothetical protein
MRRAWRTHALVDDAGISNPLVISTKNGRARTGRAQKATASAQSLYPTRHEEATNVDVTSFN